jgi:predicted RNase H-like HicB family nuclease
VKLTAVLTAAVEGGYCALNPETGTVSQGETVEQAVGNLREAVELYLEEFPFAAKSNGAAQLCDADPHHLSIYAAS